MTQMPSLMFGGLVSPGSRKNAIELARQAEDRGFASLHCPSAGDCVAFCQAALQATRTIPVGAAVQPIYHRVPRSLADTAAFLNEIGGGRFELGLGVGHAPSNAFYGVKGGKPIEDMRDYVGAMRATEADTGPLPRIVLAALRDRMVDLAIEIADGVIFANTSRALMAKQIARIPDSRRAAGFSTRCIINIVIDDDESAALGAIRKALRLYTFLPNNRAYWRFAGYVEEMDAMEAALEKGEVDGISDLFSERLLRDVALFGSKTAVREGIESCFAMGITPILTPHSTTNDPRRAFQEVFDLYS